MEERIDISYFDSDCVFIPSKVINVKEEGDKVLQWVLSQLPGGNAWKFSWYRWWEDEKFIESGLVRVYKVGKVQSLNVVLLTCWQYVIH